MSICLVSKCESCNLQKIELNLKKSDNSSTKEVVIKSCLSALIQNMVRIERQSDYWTIQCKIWYCCCPTCAAFRKCYLILRLISHHNLVFFHAYVNIDRMHKKTVEKIRRWGDALQTSREKSLIKQRKWIFKLDV